MDMETPADAWYTFVAVGIVSVGVAGIVLGMPSVAPADANAAANTVDKVTGSTFNASGSYEHDAEEVRIGGKQIAFRNDGGETKASIAFGTMVWVRYSEVPRKEDFTDILHGDDVSTHYESRHNFTANATTASNALESTRPDWKHAQGTLRARTIVWGDQRVTLVDA